MYFTSDTARQMKSSDYAKSQGCEQTSDNCAWWLRSPYYDLNKYACYVDCSGEVGYRDFVDATSYGVLPALEISVRNEK